MNPANATNATGSGTTSTSAPIPESGAKPALTEAEFLEHQAAAARTAIVDALADLKTDLATGADPRVWMKSHPWITLASAAVAGFAAAAAVVPSRERQALKKLERIERALHAGRKHYENGDGAAAEKTEHGGLIAKLLHEVFGVIKPAVISLIASHFAAPQSATEAEEAARKE